MSALLKAENICKSFGGVKALNNINMEIADNQILGVIGPNGAGKTTLFNVLTGFNSPTGGHRQNLSEYPSFQRYDGN
jgi:ABC-type branched-subunit amino acid transport system ATPase component